MTVKVKICGITSEKDLDAVCRLGADAAGFVVGVPESPRNLPQDVAKRLIRRVPIFVKSVLVTASQRPERLLELCEDLNPDVIQIHDPPLGIAASMEKIPGIALVVGIKVKSEESIQEARCAAELFDAILADSHFQGKRGGTGVTHDWDLSRRMRDAIYPKAFILAGGLNAENVVEAISKVKPYAVDVSTGVEAKPGVKDPCKVEEFIIKAKSVQL